MAKTKLQAPRGTRDFYPEDMRRRSWLFDHFRGTALGYGFEEVDAPIVEHEELFTRKAGEEILEQLYHFEMHGRRLALRGEITPSVARMVMARSGSLRLPVRWFTIGQNWRYERTTRGRKREHYQWNAEIIGEPDVSAEAELIAMIFHLLERLGVPEQATRMRVNSRALLEETLRGGPLAGREEAFAPLCVIIDKLEKIGAEAVVDQLVDIGGLVRLDRAVAEDVVETLAVRDFEEGIRRAGADSRAATELRRLFDLLDAYGLAQRVVFDASTVRGLAYYTGIVFEAFDTGGTLRALCGGGRYDRLLETLGGPSLPAVGFGFGDVVIQELLGDLGLLPELPRELDDLVFPFTEAERAVAMGLARRLREEGHRVELQLGPARLKRVLADAERIGARRVHIIGPEEAARGVARVREVDSKVERDEPLL